RAVEQQWPVTRRTLTVNGAVARPLTLTVPLGTSLREVLALAGGATINNPAYINGGPMMGHALHDLGQPVTKTTGGLLVLPADHLLITRRARSDKDVLAIARTVCEQCRMCTELCPRHLIGHELPPHLLVRAIIYQQVATPDILLSALTCSECSLCESYACPVDISPMRINRLLKTQLRAQGARYQGELREADPMAKYRMVPTARLIARLDLTDWYQAAPFSEEPYQPQQVILPLRQHIGAAAEAIVAVGERIEQGQLIGQIPHNALGAPLHASISGVVTAIDGSVITISRG
ncbi:4Fe-4S dicluster domain-containing protein, partial [Yersinia enterocolitica]